MTEIFTILKAIEAIAGRSTADSEIYENLLTESKDMGEKNYVKCSFIHLRDV